MKKTTKINKATDTALATIVTEGLKVNVTVPNKTIVNVSVAIVFVAVIIIAARSIFKLAK